MARQVHKVLKARLALLARKVPRLSTAPMRPESSAQGSFTGLLPASATANGRVPAISCYVSSDARTWLAVAQVPASQFWTYCGLTGIGTASPGITIINGTPGWSYYLIAVW